MKPPFDLHVGLGYKLTIAARTNNAGFETDLAALGLSRQMWCVLVAVGEQNIATPSAIADYIGIVRASASRTLKQMEKNGLLERRSGTKDKRTTMVMLTELGREKLAQSLPFAIATREQTNAALTADEQAHLAQLLQKLTQSLNTTATGV